MNSPLHYTSDALSEELTVIAMAKMLNSSHATRLDRHIERVWLYSGRGIAPAVSAPLDARACAYANIKRHMDDRELIGTPQ